MTDRYIESEFSAANGLLRDEQGLTGRIPIELRDSFRDRSGVRMYFPRAGQNDSILESFESLEVRKADAISITILEPDRARRNG